MSSFNRVCFEIAGICNAKCKYCTTGKANRLQIKRDGGFISPKEFEKAIEYMLERKIITAPARFTLFNYGEPFLHPQFPEIINMVEKYKFSYSLSTNASAIPRVLGTATYEHLNLIIFSVPGFSQKSYDRMHGFEFDGIKNNILQICKTLRANGFKGHARMVFHMYQFNLSELHAAKAWAFAHDMGFHPYAAYFNDIMEYYSYLTSAMDYGRLKQAGEELILYYIDEVKKRGRPQNYNCYQIPVITIDEKLNVLLCCGMDRHMPGAVLGNLYDMNLEEIVERKSNAAFCAKCQQEGLDLLIHNPLKQSGFIIKQKILYGAGARGKQAFFHYGADIIYAFADINKHGQDYLGKMVIHPSLLADYAAEYEIIICVQDYEGIARFLKDMGVEDFTIFYDVMSSAERS